MSDRQLAKRKLEALYLAGEREIAVPPAETSANSEFAEFSPISEPLPAVEETAVMPPMPKKAPVSTPLQPPLSLAERQTCLGEIRADIGDCTRCRLSKGRNNIVFGVGSPEARLMFVGEAPGRDEDIQGEPFVGRAGQLLTKIIEAMKLKRSDVYIANTVKCRPPENRNPAPDEIETCEPFLLRQIEVIRPEVIVALGNFAVQTLLQTEAKISSLRGRFHPWPSALVKAKFETSLPENSIQLMPTYHPAFLLRNPNMKRPVWEDMQKVMTRLGL